MNFIPWKIFKIIFAISVCIGIATVYFGFLAVLLLLLTTVIAAIIFILTVLYDYFIKTNLKKGSLPVFLCLILSFTCCFPFSYIRKTIQYKEAQKVVNELETFKSNIGTYPSTLKNGGIKTFFTDIRYSKYPESSYYDLYYDVDGWGDSVYSSRTRSWYYDD